jgi:periplasmic protein TonB
VFDDVTKQEGGKRAARKGAFLLGSTTLQILAVAAIILIGKSIQAKITEEPVTVKFVKGGSPPPPPPPPPKRKKTNTKKTEVRKINPSSMIQPKEIQPQVKPPETSDDDDDGVEGGVEGGVKGGVVGGVVGGVLGGTLGGTGVQEAPVYMTSGFKKPELANPRCIVESMRIPKDLQGIVSKVTIKFAISRDGTSDLFQFMTAVPDKRIEDAIKSAVQSCKFNPASDPQGRPVRIWYIMPIQMKAG